MERQCCLPLQFYKDQVTNHCSHPTPHPPWWALRGIQGREKQEAFCAMAQDSQLTHIRNNFNEPRLLHFPICSKATRIINLRCLLFVISSIFWCSTVSFFLFLAKKLLYIYSRVYIYIYISLLPASNSSSNPTEAVLWLSSVRSQNKTQSISFRLCVFLLFSLPRTPMMACCGANKIGGFSCNLWFIC